MTDLQQDLLDTMRRHEHEAPPPGPIMADVFRLVESSAPADGQERRLPTGPPHHRRSLLLVSGLVAGAVVALVLAGVIRDPEGTRAIDPAPSIAASPSTGDAQVDDAVLDPLTFALTVARPGAPGAGSSRLEVTNASGSTVIDPGCLSTSNFDYGLVPIDQPGAKLEGRVMTKCTGAQRLDPGFSQTVAGPDFRFADLPAGAYLAVIDFGAARSERLSVAFEVP